MFGNMVRSRVGSMIGSRVGSMFGGRAGSMFGSMLGSMVESIGWEHCLGALFGAERACLAALLFGCRFQWRVVWVRQAHSSDQSMRAEWREKREIAHESSM